MSETAEHSAQISRVFDAITPIVDAVNGGFFHLAYWYDETDDTPITEAGQRVTRKVADSLGLRAGEHLLDVGCGPGDPAILIARETGARITGIAISNTEIEKARKRANSSGLNGQVRFEQGDYMSLSFPDGTFDAVMAIESLLSAPDLGYVLREFNRVLRPGGRVSLCHCTREDEMSPDQLAQFNASNMAHQLPTLGEWIDALRSAGFAIEEYTQFGPRVFGQRSRYFEAIDNSYDDLLTMVDAETIAGFKKGMSGFFEPGPEKVGYAIVTARKPTA